MKLAKILMAAVVLATASMASADPKCAHKENGSLFASTNPVRKAKTSSTGPTNPVAPGTSNGAIN
ncbi:hypothetical protein [Bdellovibrio sp. NC01]|uniref:hypothetical protein n=1 Tax=Bdellovibrio sp. NC01 TaxID=2220073 RepID=UPI001158CD5A|nr:hypothetical protein [Bdellovibrio sp. NC01]QDK36193.1 hypothetical protein DOE51_00540 [Bdellovibrio sp. NC01]